jgi:uncharacterized protein
MSVELLPLGVACNLSCPYCYQTNLREASNNARPPYDLAKMKAETARAGGPFTLFGGEPLLVPLADLEDLWAWGLAQYGRNGIQTNGTLITSAHVEAFKTYRVHVGMSLDGPGALNDSRWAGSLEATRERTAVSQAALERLLIEKIPCSLIVTLYRGNAIGDRPEQLCAWLRDLDRLGLKTARLHALEIDHPSVAREYGLTDDETLAAFHRLATLESGLEHLRFDVFEDIRRLLRGQDDNVTCTWGACDPYTTAAVQAINGQGVRSNCGRTNKDGVDWVKASAPGFERYLALYHTPYRDGGCQDCRFFAMCKGQCPGTAIDGDWRNRSAQCGLWMGLFETIEAEMMAAGEIPLSMAPRRLEVEQQLVDGWARGLNLRASSEPHGDAPHGDAPHGDHTDVHGDELHDDHGDTPHGDDHGDHYDASA